MERLDAEIERLSGEARAAEDPRAKARILSEILRFREEAEASGSEWPGSPASCCCR